MSDWMRGCDAELAGNTVSGGPFPDDVVSVITFRFGPRAPIEVAPGVFTGWTDPATGQRVDFHYGIDLATPEGVPLLALGYGVVENVIVGDRSFGNAVTCSYPGGDGHTYRAIYLHMREPSLVGVGEAVVPGQVLGYVGSTGASTGPHLHMQVWRDDYTIDPLSELVEANAVGHLPPAPAQSASYAVPEVQWVPLGWGAVGNGGIADDLVNFPNVPWAHTYRMRAKTVMPSALINLHRDGRTADGWEEFTLYIQDYEPGT